LNIAGNAGRTREESKHIYNLVRTALKSYIQLFGENYRENNVFVCGNLKGGFYEKR